MSLSFIDRYQSNLTANYTAGGTSLSVVSATGLPSGSCNFYLIVKQDNVNTEEVFQVTNVSGTTLTVVGNQAGTAASNHSSGAIVIGSIMSAAAYTQFQTDTILLSGGIPISVPSTGGFTWINQSTASVTTNANGSVILATPASSGRNLRGMYRAVSVPYTAILSFIPSPILADNCQMGLLVRSSGAAFITLSMIDSFCSVDTWNSATSLNAEPLGVANNPNAAINTVRIVNDSTHRTYSLSRNGGISWIQFYQEASGTFLTETGVGFMIAGNNLSYTKDMLIISYSD